MSLKKIEPFTNIKEDARRSKVLKRNIILSNLPFGLDPIGGLTVPSGVNAFPQAHRTAFYSVGGHIEDNPGVTGGTESVLPVPAWPRLPER